jgi:LysW-gamma-L-lysine carboxypeptidase
MNDVIQPETLLGMVSRYSPSGQERLVVQWLVERMRTLGFGRSFVDPVGNAIGVMGDGRRQIVLLGHIDTYPGEVPFLVEGDALYGRGSVDAKSALAAMVDATAQVGPVDGWQIIVIAAVDEERDSTGAWYIVGQYKPEFAIIGEPSRWDRIAIGYKGIAWAEVRIFRPSAHPAARQESACEAAIGTWKKILDWATTFNADRRLVFDQILPSLREFSSGDDGLETWACLRIDTRLPQDFPPPQWYSLLQKILESTETHRFEVKQHRYPIPAYNGKKGGALVRAFNSAIRSVGGEPSFVLKTGTADLNIVAPAWRCPAIAYGPGDSNLDHTPNEHISLSEYARSVDVLREVLCHLTHPKHSEVATPT